MEAQGLVDYLCLFGKGLGKSLSSSSALDTIVDRAGVIQEEKLEGWTMERRLDCDQVCEAERERVLNPL